MNEKEKNFEMLKSAIKRCLNFFPERYKERPLKRRIAVRMRRRNITTYLEYMKLLEEDPEEEILLYKVLTINVSKFFRNLSTFVKIEEEVLPRMYAEAERNDRIIKVWCAGCATGEESYTIAMLLDRFLKNSGSTISFSVIGSDIDSDSLETARRGCYKSLDFDETPEYYLEEYFNKLEKFCVIDRLKKNVEFVNLDIEEEDVRLNELDLVLFRNVLIYMEKGFQERILSKIYSRLDKGGFLVLGKVETLVGETKKLFNIVDSRERIYRKCLIVKK